jgi:hypothetical protein
MQQLFEKNIKFFYKNIPQYYKLIKNSNKNFYIKNDNIYSKSHMPIYPNSITEDSALIASNPINNPLWQKKFYFHPKKWDEEEFYATGKIINKIVSDKNKYFFDNDFLPTTMLFGLLSGKHLQFLAEKFNFQSLFIYEPNPEFFAISCYFVDWENIYNKYGERLFLWIGGELDYFAIEKFFYERIITSSFLNIYYKAYEHPLINDAIDKFYVIQSTKLRGWGSFEDEMKGIKNHVQNISLYPLLETYKKTKAPFCIVANGKSLEKNIEFIKKNKNSLIIVSVGTAIKPLLRAGIESDFHFEQERIDILIDALKDVLPKYNGHFIGASVVNPEVFKMAKNPLMYIRESFTLEKDFKPLIGSSPIVGNAGFAFGAMFGEEIYLCGMDLGFRLNEKKHSKGSFYDNREDTAKNGIKIKGNFSDDIYTDSLLLSSKDKIEKMIEMFNLKVYNLSDGAYIKGTVPLKDKLLPKIEKDTIKKEIISCFHHVKNPKNSVNPKPLINALQEAFNLKTTSQKELTGKIDFIEDLLKEYSKIDRNAFNLLKGSIFHIALNYYAEYFKGEDKKEKISNSLNIFISYLKNL